MATYDQGGGCACGLYKVCSCESPSLAIVNELNKNRKETHVPQEPKSKWIGFDLDGTLAFYTTWGPVTEIGGPITPMVTLAKRLLSNGHDVRIFTARGFELDGSTMPEAVAAIEAWCLHHLGKVLPVTNRKDYACRCIIDDRAIAVESNTGLWYGFKKMMDELEAHHDFFE